MTTCFKQKQCLRKFAYWPGIVEAGLHCLYTGFFVIEAATYGLILEQKFHGVLQILLINFYLVLLCLAFIRWNLDLNSVVCHFLISILSFILSLFVGKLILMYIDYMERPRPISKISKNILYPVESADSANQNLSIDRTTAAGVGVTTEHDLVESYPKKVSVNAIMKLDPLIVILDISVYLLISISYIVMLLKISFKQRSYYKVNTRNPSTIRGPHNLPSFYEISSSESSIVSMGNTSSNTRSSMP